MKVNLCTHTIRPVTRQNVYKQYREVMYALDVLQEQLYYMPVDSRWKRKHIRDIFIRYLSKQETEGYGGLDSVIYNTLWEIMEEDEKQQKAKEQSTSDAPTSPKIDHTDE